MPEIWDVHCHLANPLTGKDPAARLGRLIEVADRMGISRVCVYMGMKWTYDPTPDDLRQQNDQVLTAIRRWPDRAFGFVYVNPKHGRASLDEINRCIADGPMVGVKLWVAMRANSPELDPIVERATELKAVIFQHTWLKIAGNLPGESTPMDLATLAARHPNAKIICGHTGGDWEQGVRAVRAQPNISVDLGGGDPGAGITEMAVRELGPSRVIYGSDAPGRSFASQLAKVHGAEIPDAAKNQILSANLKNFLKPILADKGIKT
jgi:predicted TIM-barrel fold metal-dependent hydrolase